jgi:hypothetical protein
MNSFFHLRILCGLRKPGGFLAPNESKQNIARANIKRVDYTGIFPEIKQNDGSVHNADP